MKSLFTILLAALVSFGCCACAKPLTEKDNGKTLNLATDDPFVVELEGDPTTGYTWTVEPFDTTVIKMVGEPKFQSQQKTIGAGGLYTFSFQTVADGQTLLRFIYHRTFEKDVPPIRTYEVNIVVGTMGQILEP